MSNSTNSSNQSKLDAIKRDILLRRLNKLGPAKEAQAGANLKIGSLARPEHLPLSWAQQRLWFLDQFDHAASTAYHMPASMQLSGVLDQAALRRALDTIVARHENLRTTFATHEGEGVQQIAAPDCGFHLLCEDLSALVADERQAQLEAISAREFGRAFDLQQGPLIRGCLLRLQADLHILLIVQHHIISDGWSVEILMRELSALYLAFSQGQENPLPPLPVQFADYALWQRARLQGAELEKQSAYWKQHLQGAPALLELPFDKVRPQQQSFEGARLELQLDPALSAQLRAFSQQQGVTLFMTLLAAWSVLLARISGQDDLVVGIPVANRQHTEVEGLTGFFANTLALRLQPNLETDLTTYLQQVKSCVLHAQAHQDMPFEKVVEIVQPPRSMAYAAIFQNMMSLSSTPPLESMQLAGLELRSLPLEQRSTQFDLSLDWHDMGDYIQGNLDYATDLFQADSMARMAERLQTLLHSMLAAPQQSLARLNLLPAAEHSLLIHDFNQSAQDFSSPWPQQLVHALFEAQVERNPEAPALVYGAECINYRELNRRANQLAHYLLSLNTVPDQRIAICMERRVEMLVAMLGVLKAGLAYVPLDPAHPADRLAYMLEDSQPAALLSQRSLLAKLPQMTIPCLLMDEAGQMLAQQAEHNPQVSGLTPAHMAYVLYTSGSTGAPKGVMVEHRNVANLINDYIRSCGVGAQDRVLQFASFGFDSSIAEIFPALTVGACLVLRAAELIGPDAAFVQFLEQEKITFVDLPTAFWHMWVQEINLGKSLPPAALRQVVTGGEKAELRHLRAWFSNPASQHCAWINAYGPTESTVNATQMRYTAQSRLPDHEIPIGRPIANTNIYILDPFLQPVPLGVAGEIHVGGAGVARGYLNREQLTQERFIPHPFSREPGARLYKTGDLGRWLADGSIEYMGRNDFQVKIRGFRIELGEIEAKLVACPGVKDAVVLARDEEGGKRLVAYFIGQQAQLDVAALRRQLQAGLADYMLPSAYVQLDAFPLNANGKIDRRALPAPARESFAADAYEAPQGALESVIAQVWQDLLKIDQVGRNDNFFQIGGHSLLLISMLEKLRAQGVNCAVRSVFAAPTPAKLAQTLAQDSTPLASMLASVPPNLIAADCQTITPDLLPLIKLEQEEIDSIVASVPGGVSNVQDIYPLAPLQDGILFHHLLNEEGDAYLSYLELEFDSRQRLSQFMDALQQVIARHDVLRTALRWQGLRQSVQVVLRQAPLALHEVQPDAAYAGQPLAQLQNLIDPRRYRLDLQQAPLVAAYAIAGTEGKWHVALLSHHIVCDHVTMELIMQEIGQILDGQAEQLPAPLQYRNFIAHLRDKTEAEHEAWFKQQLADISEPCAPLGVLDVQGDGRAIAEASQVLPLSLSAAVRDLARARGISASALFHLAWAQVLRHTCAQENAVFGTVLSGRMQGGDGAASMLGMFINTLPLRISLEGQSAEQALEQTWHNMRQLLEHEQAALALAQRCSGVAQPLPLFTTLLNYRHTAAQALHSDQLWQGIEMHGGEERTNYPITVSVDDFGVEDGFGLSVQTVPGINPQQVLAWLAQSIENLCQALQQEPQQGLHLVGILPAAERELVLHGFNHFHADYRRDYPQTLVHTLFEAQVERSPQAIALVFEDQALSYAELNLRANKLAHYLRQLGVGPEQRVGVCLERSLEMVISLLAVLKAGGAYVPLDPHYPQDRLAHMLADSAPVVLLTQAALQTNMPPAPAACRVVLLAQESAAWQSLSADNLDSAALGLQPQHLAYMIYTSGSTGMPKGAMNQHDGVVNRLLWAQSEYQLQQDDCVLQKTPFSFDVSVWEFFLPLLAGAKLCVAQPEGHRDPAYLTQVVHAAAVTTMHFVPSMLPLFLDRIEQEGKMPPALRRVLCSGEALPDALQQRFWRVLPNTELHNLYGPTEAAVDVTYWRCTRENAALHPGIVPIGKPIANIQMYVLDQYLQPVPVGVAGEIHIGGIGVGRGYLNRDSLTAEKFIADPFSTRAGAKLYKTGDLGRWLADGALEYLGRNDFQVKIRGLRIELGEIEASLAACEGVKDAVVIAREDGGSGADKRLVAYFTSFGPELDVAQLRAHMQTGLAEFMLPSAFVQLPALPVTANGKLDRRALPAPEQSLAASRVYVAPEGELEQAIADIWQDMLRQPQIGRHDNFFELGGHSLLVISMLERLRAHGVQGHLRAVFAHPTPAQLARALQAQDTAQHTPKAVAANLITADSTHITPQMLPLAALQQEEIDAVLSTISGGVANVQDIYPLAPLQEGILFHHLLNQEGDAYLLRSLLRFDDQERAAAFIAALQQVIARHDILRSTMRWQGLRQPVQVVLRQVQMQVQELALAEGESALEVLREASDPAHLRLALDQAPLLHAMRTCDSNGQVYLALLAHHIVCDHISQELMLEEIALILAGEGDSLPAALPYRDFIAHARTTGQDEHEAYFRAQLGDIDAPSAPYGVMDVHGDGSDVSEVHYPLSPELAQGIRQCARVQGVSAAALFHVAFAQVLAPLCGRQDVVFGSVLSGRSGVDARRVMGMFINTLPFRVSLGGNSAQQVVRAVWDNLGQLMQHEQASLALAQRCSAVTPGMPLFSALFNYRHDASAEEQESSWAGMEMLLGEERTNYPLLLSVDDDGKGFAFATQCVQGLDALRISRYLETAVAALVQALSAAPHTVLASLPVVPQAERHMLLQDLNQTTRAYAAPGQPALLHEFFARQLALTPQASALYCGSKRLTYAELDARANQIAHYLQAQGVQADQRIAVCLRRSEQMVIALFGILKAGAAYVPLDPAYPRERLAHMLQDSAAPVVITESSLLPVLPLQDVKAERQVQTLLLDQAAAALAAQAVSAPPCPAQPHNLAYIIYTSGSTGLPKGVMLTHANAANFIHWALEEFSAVQLRDTLFATSLNFDLHVFECYAPLACGGSIHLVENALALLQDDALHPGAQLSLINTVPSALDALCGAGRVPSSVKTVNLAGEALKRSLVERIFASTAVQTVCNLYGPSETTTYSTWVAMPRSSGFASHIGKPVANTQVYILDQHLQVLPLGVAGEIWIAGAGVARGYLNLPQLTAERFIDDPFAPAGSGARMYKTGDMGRWRADGNIDYLGRNDFQVKIRGFRIELGEIENHINTCPGVKESVVLAREDEGQAGNGPRLVAYVLPQTVDGQLLELDVEAIAAHISTRLAAYMLPSAWVVLPAFPLNPNGKLDRKALPAPQWGQHAEEGEALAAPEGETERKLAALWAQVLGLDVAESGHKIGRTIGRDSHFFEIGGHSLLAVQLLNRIEENFACKPALRDLFAQASLSQMAQLIESMRAQLQSKGTASGADLTVIAPRAADSRLPLSFAQQRLWLLAELDPAASSAYHMPAALRLRGKLDVQALQATLDAIYARHEALRTHFTLAADGQTEQVIAPADEGFALQKHDLCHLQGKAQEKMVEQILDAELSAPFDLRAGPLIRASLLQLRADEYLLFLVQHHIISDGWSINVLVREVGQLYAALSQGQANPLSPLAVQYPDYAIWQRTWLQGERLQQQTDWWRQHLAAAPALLEMPLDYPRPALQTYAGAKLRLELPLELATALRRFSQQQGTTLFMSLFAAWALLLARMSGQNEVVIGTPVANRERRETEGLIGFFVNTLALRVKIDPEQNLLSLVQQVKDLALNGFAHQELPFEQVVEALQPPRSLAYSPLFQVMFVMHNQQPGSDLQLGDVHLQEVALPHTSTHFDLMLELSEDGDTISGQIEYATALFKADSIARIGARYLHLLQEMLADAKQTQGQIGLLPVAEAQLLDTLQHGSQSAQSAAKLLHHLVEQQAARQPQALAVVQGSTAITYAELNQRANLLAAHLLQLGSAPDARVAVCMERSPQMVVALLAILKAGAGYVPLDPSYPGERLAMMLDGSQPLALLTEADMLQRLPLLQERADAQGFACIRLAEFDFSASAQAVNPQVPDLHADHLAYVIYTSGSTGVPKGVAMPHRPLLNLLAWQQSPQAQLQTPETTLQFAALGFDVAFQEIFSTLAQGAKLVLINEQLRRDPQALVQYLAQQQVQRIFLPFIALQNLAEAGNLAARQGEHLPHLRNVITAGEQLRISPALVEFFSANPERKLHNHYGPTETHVATALTLDGSPASWPALPSIGKPIANSEIRILDAHLQPVPLGVAGEVYICGTLVARGYLQRPDLSAERFLQDAQGVRMYKTGDLARWLDNGEIEYLGRNDFQLKIRGFRVELGEIEARLARCAGVREVAVLARSEANGEKRLLAYLVADEGVELDAQALRAELARDLAEYMLPAAFIVLDKMPQTPNGKLDRTALFAADPGANATLLAGRSYVAPEGEMEILLAQLWQELLHLPQVGRNDHFFELGGHSLLALQLVSRLQALHGLQLALREVFAQPVLSDLAQSLHAAQGSRERGPQARASGQQALPLSFAQQRLWFLHQLEPAASLAYHLPYALRLQGRLDLSLLQATFDALLARHESLRTRFVPVGEGEVVQVIAEQASLQIAQQDLRSLDAAGQQAALRDLQEREARTPFNMEQGPLLRAHLLHLAQDDAILLLNQHHIISDGWSLSLLVREVGQIYTQLQCGAQIDLPPLPLQYADYALWQRQYLQGEVLAAQTRFWQHSLQGAPALLELPTDKPRPAVQSFVGDSVSLVIDSQLRAQLLEFGQQQGNTLFMTLLAAFAALLSRMSGQNDVVIGTPVANRQHPQLENLIGFFVNTLALRLRPQADHSVSQFLSQVRETALAGFAHQDLPFEQVVEALQPPRSLAYSPLFQVMFSLNNTPDNGPLQLPGLSLQAVQGEEHSAHFDLTFGLVDDGREILGTLEYASDLFERASVERMVQRYLGLLRAMVKDATQSLAALPYLTPCEHDWLLHGANSTERDYPADEVFPDLFAAQVAAQPEAVALVFEDTRLSYAELNRRANQVAHYLLAQGVQHDERVAISVERAPELVIAILGVMKAGAAYVPLDPAYPAARLRHMLQDSAPRVLLTQARLLPVLSTIQQEVAPNLPVLCLDQSGTALDTFAAAAQQDPVTGLQAQHLAYVIYTSGSTGLPKGVMNHHRGLCNLVRAQSATFGIDAESSVLQFASISFDACIWEICLTLCAGATLHLARREDLMPGEPLLASLQAVTHAFLPPSALTALPPEKALHGLGRVHTIVVGGEACPPALARTYAAQYRFFNAYGPTECTVCATTYACSTDLQGALPIGRPTANTQIYILDQDGKLLPQGSVGEIHIGGIGVARGYLHRPELTQERFIPNPFAAGTRLYKTGDLGRWRNDGNIDYLGRNDFQVKIRGFRIELGEIESRLAACQGVKEAVVIADGPHGQQRLLAYVVPQAGADLQPSALRAELAQGLAEFMLPAAYVVLAALPLTQNGKLDRQALPAPQAQDIASRAYVAPHAGIETALAAIWQELLGLQQVGRHDHFFEVGGHSLLAVQLAARIKQQMGKTLALVDLFTSPTLADLAQRLQQAGTDNSMPPLLARNAGENLLPLSWAQQRLWFLDQLDPEASRSYHLPLALHLQGDLQREALQQSLNLLIARHESLRTRFVLVEGQPRQQILSVEESGFVLQEQDLRDLGDLAQQAAYARISHEHASSRFDLATGPLLRAGLLQMADDDHILLLCQHHIISDGWSMSVFAAELQQLYAALSQGQSLDVLPPNPVQYADYALWQRKWLQGAVLEQQIGFWRQHLQGAPALLELPLDYPRPSRQTYAGGRQALHLGAELSAQLRSFSQQHGATVFMSLLANFAHLLARYSGQDDIVIGTPVANRQQAELEGMIGFFVNTLALRVAVDGGVSAQDLLQQVKRNTLAAQQHQDLPFEQVVEALQPARSLAHSPIFQVMFSWNNTPQAATLELPGLSMQALAAEQTGVQFDLYLALSDDGTEISGSLDYCSALFKPQTVARMAQHFVKLLQAMLSQQGTELGRLPMLDGAEKELLLTGFNQTAYDFSAQYGTPDAQQFVHTLFEAQVERNPHAPALAFGEQELSYAELNRRANRLAHHLRSLGVGPEQRVGVCLERSLEMVISLLAVLKAGGAYVPLDPHYPQERLAHMLADSAPVVLLTERSLLPNLPELQVETSCCLLLLAEAGSDLDKQSSTNLPTQEIGLSPTSLAYMIYTSGSTGLPKGAMNQHDGVVNRLLWAQSEYQLQLDDCVLQKTPFSFDVSVWEFFLPLLAGAKLVVAKPEGHKDPAYLAELVAAANITTMHFVPSMLPLFLDQVQSSAVSLPKLRRVLCSGEALPPALQQRCWQVLPGTGLHNLYGPTEAAVDVTYWRCTPENAALHQGIVPIGKPIANIQMYVLDAYLQPVPLGVAGEIHIGGIGVGRGYLNRDELTAERFIADPFSTRPGARLYKTGDLGRWLEDGAIEYLGRNDFQVKLRGFRIELGEIEARLAACAGIKEAVVVAREDGGDKRLVAYFTCLDAATVPDLADLRQQLQENLADYMLPSAFVHLEQMPLSANGKLERRALPAPQRSALAAGTYVAPQGALETAIAGLWQEMLSLPQVGRDDNFFELGGHSLLVISMLEGLRARGLHSDVRSVFANPTPAKLAQVVQGGSAAQQPAAAAVPANLISADSAQITPQMLPLVTLSQSEIDSIVSSVPGGVANIQDIYALAPLQEGILFHHLLNKEGDAYLLHNLLRFADKARLDAFLAALNQVLARHDILRTTMRWQGLAQPVQVVLRSSALGQEVLPPVVAAQAQHRLEQALQSTHQRLDLQSPCLISALMLAESDGQGWHLALRLHHIISDHITQELILGEVAAILAGQGHSLPASVPYRRFIAQARQFDNSAHEAYFRAQLADIDSPSAPFGLLDVQGDGSQLDEVRVELDQELAQQVRSLSRQYGVSSAALFHVAYAQVLRVACGRDDLVFGTVLSGRSQGEGTGQIMGMFINSLPLRVDMRNGASVQQVLRQCWNGLSDLMMHEQAALALAQRCSGVPGNMPLFTALLNFRHSGKTNEHSAQAVWDGVELITGSERSNYPLGVSVDDFAGAENGDGFGITVQISGAVKAARVAAYLQTAMAALVQALQQAPDSALSSLSILPAAERALVLDGFNQSSRVWQGPELIQQIFEQQVAATPEALALSMDGLELSYAELNRRANLLAQALRKANLALEDRVAICLPRSVEMVIGLLACLKAGCAYVPMDPAYPRDRLAHMLQDSAPRALLTLADMQGGLQEHLALDGLPQLQVLAIDSLLQAAANAADPGNPDPAQIGVKPDSLAYVIYTSGSTGLPKGVANIQRGLCNLVHAQIEVFGLAAGSRVLQFASFSFDASISEIMISLCSGASLHLASREQLQAGQVLRDTLVAKRISHVTLPSSVLPVLPGGPGIAELPDLTIIVAGEACPPALAAAWAQKHRFINAYGPTEATVCATTYVCDAADATRHQLPIGKPIANTRILILDANLQAVPLGVEGEIHIGGVGVARGYLNRDELTAERFIADPFSTEPGARLYKTGDLGRWLEDGSIEYLGRNDFQIKIRGYRIELGELEARLAACHGVKEVAVLALNGLSAATQEAGGKQDKRLVAYLVPEAGSELLVADLRAELAKQVPEFMLPSAFVILPALPLTSNGKLDRAALPAPERSDSGAAEYQAPQGPVEQELAQIWQDLLGLSQVGRLDHFFELGGHSLLAVQLSVRIQEQFGIEMPLKQIFDHPQLAQMADVATALQLAQYSSEDMENMEADLASMSEEELLAFLAANEVESEEGGSNE